MAPNPHKIVFACVQNAGRSQMAAAFFNQMADPTVAVATSAGTQPGTRIHPEVVTVMREAGIDLSRERPRLFTDEIAHRALLIVSMGCGDDCPVALGARRDDWPLEDPAGKDLDTVRRIRDEIHDRVRALIEAEFWGSVPASGA